MIHRLAARSRRFKRLSRIRIERAREAEEREREREHKRSYTVNSFTNCKRKRVVNRDENFKWASVTDRSAFVRTINSIFTDTTFTFNFVLRKNYFEFHKEKETREIKEKYIYLYIERERKKDALWAKINLVSRFFFHGSLFPRIIYRSLFPN